MAAGKGLTGKDIALSVGGATILGTVTKEFAVSRAAIDVTDDQSSGNQELLASGGVKATNLSISGHCKDYGLLITILNDDTHMVQCIADMGDGVTTETNLTFDALLTEYSVGGESNEGVEWSATLSSSGAVVVTAGT